MSCTRQAGSCSRNPRTSVTLLILLVLDVFTPGVSVPAPDSGVDFPAQESQSQISLQIRGCHGAFSCGLCQCCIAQKSTLAHCRGPNITDVVEIGVPANVTELTFEDTEMEELYGEAHPDEAHAGFNISKFCHYPSLKKLTFRNNLLLKKIHRGAFDFSCSDIDYSGCELQDLFILKSPGLINMDFSLGTFGTLQNLYLTSCGLTAIPKWGTFSPSYEDVLLQLDLSNNNIKTIGKHAFQHIGTIGTIILDDNKIEVIGELAFAESMVKEIRIQRNKNLRKIQPNAFVNSSLLEILDLSDSNIEMLPTSGLKNLHTLKLRNVPSLKVFPFVVEMSSMKKAELTYSYHCCAFSHPEKQDRDRYAEFERYIKRECSTTLTPSTTPRLEVDYADSGIWGAPVDKTVSVPTVPRHLKRRLLEVRNRISRSAMPSLARDKRSFEGDTQGSWNHATLDPRIAHTKVVECGQVVHGLHNVSCTPSPDAFNPCEDIMGYVWLRVIVWLVVLTALFGNSLVLVVTALSKYKLTVAKFLMCNLSFADLCLGFYLLLLAAFDANSSGHYFSVAFPWQYGGGCQTAGFLATFSVCLGVYTLAVITVERWYAISYAIDLSKRIRMKQAYTIMTIGHFYSLLMAVLPLLGISGYSKTSICLPMETSRTIDLIYVILLLLFNGTVFSIIFICYVDMYRQVRGNNTAAGRNDANIAKRMSILVFTDFACFFPMAFFGLTAAAGRPLITITDSKILLVFFFPLNSCANPFLYAIFTNQFKKDWQGLLTRLGLSESTATQPRGVNWNHHISLSHSRNSQGNAQKNSGSGTPLTSLLSSSSSDHRLSNRLMREQVPKYEGSQYNSVSREMPPRALHRELSKDSSLEWMKEGRRLSIVMEASNVHDEDLSIILCPQSSDQRVSMVESLSTEHDVVDLQDYDTSPEKDNMEESTYHESDIDLPRCSSNCEEDFDIEIRGQPEGEESILITSGSPVDVVIEEDCDLADDYLVSKAALQMQNMMPNSPELIST